MTLKNPCKGHCLSNVSPSGLCVGLDAKGNILGCLRSVQEQHDYPSFTQEEREILRTKLIARRDLFNLEHKTMKYQFENALPSLLKMQDATNKKLVGEDWAHKGLNWLRAIGQESAEASDHYGWAWWKKQEPNLTETMTELMDILHFWLSHQFTINPPNLSYKELAVNIMTHYEEYPENDFLKIMDYMRASAYTQQFNVGVLLKSFDLFGMDVSDVVRRYAAKNTLNGFRAENGYKAGTYIKMWHGEEDNVVLNRLLVDKPALIELFKLDPDNAVLAIKDELKIIYSTVLNGMNNG